MNIALDSNGADLPPMPPEAPLEMPVQDFRRPPPKGPKAGFENWRVWLARLIALRYSKSWRRSRGFFLCLPCIA